MSMDRRLVASFPRTSGVSRDRAVAHYNAMTGFTHDA